MKNVPQNHPQEKSVPRERNQWWYIADLIAGLDAPPTVKYLLERVRRHTNRTSGCAWASQKTLAREMAVDERSARRAFAYAAKKLKVLKVERVRTGKLPSEQHNKYSLDVERMKALQRPDEPSPVVDDTDEHRTHVSYDEGGTQDKSGLNTGQNCPGTQDTGVLGGSKQQVPSRAGFKDDSASDPDAHSVDANRFLQRFAEFFGYSIEEADARLGWIFARANARKKFLNPIGPHVRDVFAYVLKANQNLDLQKLSEPGGVHSLVQQHSFAEMFDIPLPLDE